MGFRLPDVKSHDDAKSDMTESNDQQSLALIIAAKDSLRAHQRVRTWEERVRAIAQMNVASKLAKAAMARAQQSLS